MSPASYSKLLSLAEYALAAIAVVVVAGQVRKPSSWIGRLVVRGMDGGHAGLSSWALGRVAVQPDFTMLDVGCGGGRTIRALAGRAPRGKVFGIDYSSASVAAARSSNAQSIADGRVHVQLASVSKLPFESNSFDLVTAMETHYYWPDLPADLKEVLRVLKPGGRFVIIAEAYRGRRLDWVYRPAMALLRAKYLTLEEHRRLLVDAGYADVEVVEERAKGWMTATGSKELTGTEMNDVN